MSDAVMEQVQVMQEQLRVTLKVLEGLDMDAVSSLVDRLYDAYETGKRVFICGNGGSAAAASHFAEDLAKGILTDMSAPRRLRVQSLTDNAPFITALGNDCGYDSVFREQLITNASAGDLVIAISGSGNSPNVLAAVQWARDNGLFTCGMTGFDGGKLAGMVDLQVHAPVREMEVAENLHMVVIHLVVTGLRSRVSEKS